MNHPVIFGDFVKMQILTQETRGGPESVYNKLPVDANIVNLRDHALSCKKWSVQLKPTAPVAPLMELRLFSSVSFVGLSLLYPLPSVFTHR